MRKIFALIFISLSFLSFSAQNRTVVADYESHQPLPKASVFDKRGNFTGVCDSKGRLPVCSIDEFPLTVRYLGYTEATIRSTEIDTVFLYGYSTELPELIIETKNHRILHILAYVREYSTLTTMADTVSLFREKMVDFMKPVANPSKFKGWITPRILNTRSYYRFSNAEGLDSVSDRCSHHFSWSDWMGLPPERRVPPGVLEYEVSTDTVFGKYSYTELWRRNKERINLDVDILADTTSRKWVPNLSLFFRNYVDFERFNVYYTFDDVYGPTIDETNICGYSFNIESKGRGRGMFMFNRRDEAFYVSTYCEVYIVDKEYITEKEARKWEKMNVVGEEMGFYIPEDIPELQPVIMSLVKRVNDIDHVKARLASTPDLSHIGYEPERLSPGQRILNRLKGMFGIDKMAAKRKWNKNYKEFRENQKNRNRK